MAPQEQSKAHPLYSVFLGGTCGNSAWRVPAIAILTGAGIPKGSIFNPVVADWTPECQAVEDEAKVSSKYVLFYITDPGTEEGHVSAYSLVEAIMNLYDRPTSTVVIFDLESVVQHTHLRKALAKASNDLKLRFPNAFIFNDRFDGLSFLVQALKEIN